jgi:hypothetical protein
MSQTDPQPPLEGTEPAPPSPAPRKKWYVRVRNWIAALALGGIAFLFLVYALLLLPPVQRFVVKQVSSFLSSELETEVRLGGVKLQLFDRFALEDLMIEDREGNVLLESQRTEVNFGALILNLFRKRMVVQDLTLQHARFNLMRRAGQAETNLQFIADYLKNDKPKKNKKPLDLRVKRFFLENVEFVQIDSVKGSELRIYVREGDGVVDEFDLLTSSIQAKQIFLDGLEVGVNTFAFDSAFYQQIFPDSLWAVPQRPFASFPTLCADIVHVRDGKFRLNNYRMAPVRLTPEDILDFNYLSVNKINFVVRSFSLADEVFYGNIDLFSFEESSGFELKQLTARHARVSSKAVELFDMRLTTPKSSLGDTLVLNFKEYRDFITFPDAVKMEIKLRNSAIWIDDIITFAPELGKNPFFRKNRDEVLAIDGDLLGKVNSLRGKDLKLRLARNTVLEGNFSSLFLAVPDLASLNLRLDRLETNIRTLRELIPDFNLPANFDNLGRLVFSGSFDGFFTDFVAYGDLRTALGRATMDMNLSQGKELPEYSGKLSLLNFDLKGFTGDPNFGNVTFTSRVIDGKGLTGATANARLEARIDSFSYRNYQYENVNMLGQLNRNLFDGELSIQDPNIDLNFNGAIDFTQEVPFFDFTANVRRVDLYRLNLSEKDFVLSGKIDLKLRDTDLSKIQGEVALRDFLALKDRAREYLMDSLKVVATGAGSDKRLTVESEMLHAEMAGRFNLDELPAVFSRFLERNYTAFFNRMGLPKAKSEPDSSRFSFQLTIDDTGNWPELLLPELGPIRNGRLEGFFSNYNDSALLELDLPVIQLGETVFKDVYLNADAMRDTCVLDLGVFNTLLGPGRELAPISLLGLINRDTLNFGITAVDYDRLLNKFEVDGLFFLDEQDFFIRFAESKMVILNNEWQIRKNNFIRFGKDYIQTRDFVLTSGKRSIVLQSLDRRGLQLYMRNFNLRELNEILDYEPMDFAGGVNIEASIDDLFRLSGLHLIARTDSLLINAIDYGALRLDVEAENLKSPFNAEVSVEKEKQLVEVSGFYNPPKYEHDPKDRRHPSTPNFLKADARLADFPLAFLEIWIGDGVSDTEGLVTGSASFSGHPAKPQIRGEGIVRKAATTIDFLNTRYFIDNQKVALTNNMIDATGAIVTDQFGNQAFVTGGITHDHMKNMGLNAQIKSDNFLMLNTKKGQNEMFYGTAIASGNLIFTGPLEKADIYVSATSKPGTHIVLPISSERTASEVSFIHFTQRYRKPDSDDLTTQASEVLGVSVEMDLNITDDAVLELVFDEQAGDIMKGRGNGTIQMVVPRTGDFQMFGEYIISSGEYLFTLMNLVNKPFEVRRGGIVRWSGDPFGALINIDAEYKDLKATLTNFLAEYLVNEQQAVKDAARLTTEVDLIMNLSGELLKPSVGFDIEFPRVPNELRNATDSKLRTLRQDQNEMNRQVFGLIVIGQFLPSQNALQGQELAIGINTLTEMLSQQLSLYLTGLVSEWLTEDGLVSGIDFDIAYSYLQGTDASDPDQLYRANELQVRLKNYLFNDRLSVNVGGNFDLTPGDNISGNPNSGLIFAGDLAVEYLLTKDQTLKIRFYQSTEPEIGGGGRNRTGLGLSFRREFDTFDEFLHGLRDATKKMKKSG